MITLTSIAAEQNSARSPGESFRPDVQGLRAVAVGLVLASHASIPFLTGGFVGVDVFFVISGFLITGLLLSDAARGPVSLTKFYSRRALRILPAATVVIIATDIASALILNPFRARQVLDDSIWASFFSANIKFGREGTDYFSQADTSPLQHFWSLAVEEQYYLIWPALLAITVFVGPALWARRPGAPRRTGPPVPLPRGRIAAVLAMLFVASLAWSVRQTAQEPTAAYFSTLTRAWELILGALLAVCVPYLGLVPETVRALLGWAGLAGIALAAVLYDETTPFPGSAALLPTVATAAVLAGGALAPRYGANRLLERQPLRFTGDISYSLYLWHWPLLILGAAYAGHELRIRQNLLLVAVAFALATMSYYWIENPLRRAKVVGLAQQRRSLRLWPVAVGAVVIVAAIGFAVLPSRLGTPGAAPVSASTPAGPAEVKQSVLAARAAQPLPSNLEPDLEGLLADVTKIGECSGYKQTSNKICQLGDPNGDRAMVMFGNSHAVAWLPALSEAAKSAGWQLFPVVKEACDYPGYLGDPSGQCAQWYRWALPQIAALNPDLIIVNGYDAGDGWQSALGQAIDDLEPLGSHTVLLSDPPGVGAKPFDCLQRTNANLGTCAYPIRPAKIAADDLQAQMAAAAEVEFLNVRSWFCYDNTCPSVVGNRIVYADVGHISQTYAAHLAPLLVSNLHLSG